MGHSFYFQLYLWYFRRRNALIKYASFDFLKEITHSYSPSFFIQVTKWNLSPREGSDKTCLTRNEKDCPVVRCGTFNIFFSSSFVGFERLKVSFHFINIFGLNIFMFILDKAWAGRIFTSIFFNKIKYRKGSFENCEAFLG